MQILIFCLLLFLFPTYFLNVEKSILDAQTIEGVRTDMECELTEYQQLYAEMQLEDLVNYTAFEEALIGYQQIHSEKPVMTLIDFSKPSSEERLYVFDLNQRKVLFVSHVSHGRNSGGNYARDFSNEVGSFKSSLGFYVTEKTYFGKNGYSLVLNGLEKGVNDRAKERAIVIHGASYANTSLISSMGRLGRSQGCPALPKEINKPIIDTIKDGSVLYIYSEDADYREKSEFFSPQPFQT